MADNKRRTDPVAEIAERALQKTSVVYLKGWSGVDQRYLFIAPYDCRIERVRLLSDTGVGANDANYYAFQLRNLGQSSSLLGSRQTTRASGGRAIEADGVYELAPDQNEIFLGGEALELQVTKGGSPTDLSGAEIIAAVEYT